MWGPMLVPEQANQLNWEAITPFLNLSITAKFVYIISQISYCMLKKKPPKLMKWIYLESLKHVWGLFESKSTAWVMPDIPSTYQSPWHRIHCPNCKSSFIHWRELLISGHSVLSFLGGASSFSSPLMCPGWDLHLQVWSMRPSSQSISSSYFLSHSGWFRNIGNDSTWLISGQACWKRDSWWIRSKDNVDPEMLQSFYTMWRLRMKLTWRRAVLRDQEKLGPNEVI